MGLQCTKQPSFQLENEIIFPLSSFSFYSNLKPCEHKLHLPKVCLLFGTRNLTPYQPLEKLQLVVLLYCLDFADPEDLAIFVYSLLCSVKKIRLDFFGSSNKKRTNILLFKSVNNIIYNFLISWTDSSTVLDCSRRWQSLFCFAALLSYKAVAAALQLLQVLV